MGVTITAVVPTLGASPHLAACLEALRADGGEALRLVVVAQGRPPGAPSHPLAGEADLWLDLPKNLGFTGGTNAGIAEAESPYVATVNDDAVVQPGWCAALVEALETDPAAAAAQGVNLAGVGSEGDGDGSTGESAASAAAARDGAAEGTPAGQTDLTTPRRIDGWGLGWNRWWQAVQLGHGQSADTAPREIREVFGVSATAALYRRDALAAVSEQGAAPFDPRLVSWYEDADLAVRLRRAGWRALTVPAARADHAGGATAAGEPSYGALLYGNRWLVAAQLLGRRFPLAAPRLLIRDLADAARAKKRLPAILTGWGRAVRHLPGWWHGGPPVDVRRD